MRRWTGALTGAACWLVFAAPTVSLADTPPNPAERGDGRSEKALRPSAPTGDRTADPAATLRSLPVEWNVVQRLAVGAVCLVVVGIGLLYVRRSWTPGASRLSGVGGLEILGRAALSPRHAVYLLRVEDRRIVVGVSGEHMVSLGTLEESASVKPSSTHRPEPSRVERRLDPSPRSVSEADLLPYRRQVTRLREMLTGRGAEPMSDRDPL